MLPGVKNGIANAGVKHPRHRRGRVFVKKQLTKLQFFFNGVFIWKLPVFESLTERKRIVIIPKVLIIRSK